MLSNFDGIDSHTVFNNNRVVSFCFEFERLVFWPSCSLAMESFVMHAEAQPLNWIEYYGRARDILAALDCRRNIFICLYIYIGVSDPF